MRSFFHTKNVIASDTTAIKPKAIKKFLIAFRFMFIEITAGRCKNYVRKENRWSFTRTSFRQCGSNRA